MIRIFLARKIENARDRRERAAAALQRAMQANDTRAMHSARQAMQKATHDLMRLEMRAG